MILLQADALDASFLPMCQLRQSSSVNNGLRCTLLERVYCLKFRLRTLFLKLPRLRLGGGHVARSGRVLLRYVRLVVLGQVRLLPEALPAEPTSERLLPGMSTNMHIDRVLVLEALRADTTIVQTALLPHPVTRGRGALHRRLLGAAGRPLVLLRPGGTGGFRARARAHHGSAGYRNRRVAQVVQHAHLLRVDAVHVVVAGGGVDLAELVHGLGHLVGDAFELLEVFGVRVVQLREQDVVHAVRAGRVVVVVVVVRLLLEDDGAVRVDSRDYRRDLVHLLLFHVNHVRF